jgi:hypothetical protein
MTEGQTLDQGLALVSFYSSTDDHQSRPGACTEMFESVPPTLIICIVDDWHIEDG